MTNVEFSQALKRLTLAFEKTLSEEHLSLWWSELRNYSLQQIQCGVRNFLESPTQKTFPKLGEFKAVLGKSAEEARRSEFLSSCPRCTGGLCSVTRLVGQFPGPIRYTFRCSCASGSHYPGIPLVSPFERTMKEEFAARRSRAGFEEAFESVGEAS